MHSKAWAEITGHLDQGEEVMARPSALSSVTAPARSPVNPAIADLLATLAARFPASRDADPNELDVRLELLAEDVSDALDPETCRAAIRSGVKAWRFLPSCAEIVEHAQPFLAERRARNREQREARQTAEQRRLPPPVYVNPDDAAAVLADMYAKLNAGHLAMTGSPMPGLPRVQAPKDERPLRAPTQAELAALAVEFATARIAAPEPRP